MKIIEYNTIPVEKEVSFDMEHLKDIFEDITNDNCGKIDDQEILDTISDSYIFSEQEIKQIPKLYNEWYSKDENCQCREEIKRVLDDIYEKYPNADVESCINDYFDNL